MKKSEAVMLTLVVGAMAALNLERQPNTVRNTYNTREDCVQDYSDTQCKEDTSSSRRAGIGGSGGRWLGPDYRDDESARRSQRASGKETVRRGGFGLSGRGSSG